MSPANEIAPSADDDLSRWSCKFPIECFGCFAFSYSIIISVDRYQIEVLKLSKCVFCYRNWSRQMALGKSIVTRHLFDCTWRRIVIGFLLPFRFHEWVVGRRRHATRTHQHQHRYVVGSFLVFGACWSFVLWWVPPTTRDSWLGL